MATVSWGSSSSVRRIRTRRTSLAEFLARLAKFAKSKLSSPRTRALVAAFLLFLGLECVVRVVEYGAGSTISETRSVAARKLPSGTPWRGLQVNSWGYWDSDFTAEAPDAGIRRVALLGDSSLMAGDAETNVAARLERGNDRLEVDHFALPGMSPREFTAQFSADVVRRRPETAFVCLTMTPEAEKNPSPRPWVEWHTLELFSSLAGPSAAHAEAGTPPLLLDAATLDYDEFVRLRSPIIGACRLGEPTAEFDRHREEQVAVERLAGECRSAGVRLVLVLVPGEFQLSPQLTAAYCRRQECEPTALDIDLPQRRWRAFAEHLGVSTIDLLPALRESGEVVYMTNSPQWNARGLEVVAAMIGQGI